MIFNLNKPVFVALGCVIAFLVCLLYNKQVRLSSYEKQIEKFGLLEQSFIEKRQKDSSLIVEQKQIILTKNEAIKLGLIQNDELKKLSSKVKINYKFKIDSVFVPYIDTFFIKDTIYPKGVINVPKSIFYTNNYYSINGKVLESGLLIDSFSFNNKMSVTIGNKSKGFFKSSEPIVEIKNSNPYIKTIDMNNVIIKNDLKFYDRKIFWYGAGVLSFFTIKSIIK